MLHLSKYLLTAAGSQSCRDIRFTPLTNHTQEVRRSRPVNSLTWCFQTYLLLYAAVNVAGVLLW